MAITATDIQDAAFLANAAYQTAPSQFVGDWQLLSYGPNELNMTASTWDDGHSTALFDFNNSLYVFDKYRSQAIVAIKGNKIVLAFRGSEQSDEGSPPKGDFYDAAYHQLNHYNNFSQLITAFNNYILNRNLDVIITGHSLGAAMAEIYIIRDAYALTTPKLITFGSPGVNSEARIGASTVSNITGDAIQFVHEGDPITYAKELVNGGGNLQGSVVKIDLPELTDGPQHSSSLLEIPRWAQFDEQVEEHSMSNYDKSAEVSPEPLPIKERILG